MATTTALETEMATYRRKLPELENEQGRFALIHGEDLVGVFSAYDDALDEGYKEFGLNPFLVQKIEAIEQVQFISRFLIRAVSNPSAHDGRSNSGRASALAALDLIPSSKRANRSPTRFKFAG